MELSKVLFSPDEAGTYLGVSRTTIYRLLNRGNLQSIHIGSARRITRESMEALVNERLQQI